MTFAQSFRDLKRISRVVNVLFRNGLGYFIREFNLKLHLPFSKKLAIHKFRKPAMPEVMLRKSMEELGGSFVKLGQLLSVRPDLVPFHYCKEFSKLQDRVEPFAFSKAKKIIEDELGQPISKVFSSIEKQPIGSASISQVYAAKLKNGKKVVIKVKRPGIKEIFDADIDIMGYFARRMEQSERFIRYSPSKVVEEFKRYTKKELDFLVEASNIQKFCKTFKGDRSIRIPSVYPQHSTSNMIILEFLPGKKLSELLNKNQKFNRKMVAKLMIKSGLKMVFEDGFFHADMHPGNILVTKNGIGLLDFGIVGRLKPLYKKEGLKLWVALINEDTDAVIRSLMRTGKVTGDTDIDLFKKDVEDILDEWYGKELKQIRMTHMLHRLFDSCFDHSIIMPPEMTLYAKSLITSEGTGMQLYPSFNFAVESQPYLKKYMKRDFFPKDIMKAFSAKSQEIVDFMGKLPTETMHALEKLKQGKLKIDIDDTDIKHLGMEIDKSSNRLSYSLVIAALIVGGAWTTQIGGPGLSGYPFVSLLFFILAFILGLVLMVSIYKEGKTKY